MTLDNILSDKVTRKSEIKTYFGLEQKYKPLWLIKLSNIDLIKNLMNWLEKLPASFIIVSDLLDSKTTVNNIIITNNFWIENLSWFDFILSDDNIDNITIYSSKWVTPIILKNNHLWNILKEFNPMKNEWNAFLYDENNEWCIFHSLVRYLENYKFPYDNKNLVKNFKNI